MSETKMYSVIDKWTDLNTENIVDFTSVDGVVTEARVNGVPAGGGSSDFSTIEVTLSELSGQAVYMPYALSLGENGMAASVVGDVGAYNAIAYKGTCIAELIAAGYSLEVVSGSAELVETNVVAIGGPCTLRVVPD